MQGTEVSPSPQAGMPIVAPTEPGSPWGGGFYVGRLHIAGALHALIVAPKEGGELHGAWHSDSAIVAGARDCADGLTNTRNMAVCGSELADRALAARLGGFDDWHIPARDALEMLYRYLKPGVWVNECNFRDGDNPSSAPPGFPYTPLLPEQTNALPFRDGASEALAAAGYWSSTESSSSPSKAYFQDFDEGFVNVKEKFWSHGIARLVRVIPLFPQ